jgi:hypothetical protein
VQLDTLGILLGFAAVTFAALEPQRWQAALISAAGFAAVVLWVGLGLGLGPEPGPGRFPGASSVAFLVVGAAALALAKPRWSDAAAACAGGAAGLWAGVLELQGLPVLSAAIVAALPPAASALLARRNGRFAPAALREEALALVVVFGLLVALVPEVVAGWRAAAAFGSLAQEASEDGTTAWMLILAILCAAGGSVYSLWRRR